MAISLCIEWWLDSHDLVLLWWWLDSHDWFLSVVVAG